jgi:gliding motility-associated-like protein
MKSTTYILLTALFSAFALTSYAQQITMQSGYFEQCGGGFLDSGAGGASYSDNENFTLTICPDVPGDVIGVNFILFNLNTTDTDPSPNNNNQDRLIVYDGNSTAAPSLGTFTGNSLQGVFISASPFNTTGCLTFRFISNNVGVGDWAGTITCDTPCDRPTAVGSDNAPANRRICVGDVINFNGSASFPGAGFNIASYLWDFGDGTTANTAVANHSWSVPGEYIVELYLLDNNDCASTNRISLQILVATLPDWDPFPESTSICLGESVSWSVDPNDFEVTWTAGDPSQYNPVDDILADVVGACYEFPLEITGFAPGQTLTDINDLFSVDIDIYHTFLFDLAIFIECPNGNQVILHQQMQQPSGGNVGANGTDLGSPGTQTTWNYAWTPQATQTWSQVGTTGANVSLPAGDYMALQPMSGLVGCDLNGTWTLSICDLWGGDAGYLGGWGLSINPLLIPDVTEFTPQIGAGADSSYWTGPFIINTSPNGNNITITPSQVGIFNYTYNITNNHGCQHDTTITIEVTPGPIADAGPDLFICDDPVQLEGSVDGLPQPEPTCVYTIQMFDTFGDGWNGFTVTIIQNGVSLGTFTFNTGTQSTATFTVNHGSTIQINTTAGTWPTEVSYNILNSIGGIFFSDAGTQVSGTPILVGNNIFTGTADCQPGVPDYVYQWTPATGLSDTTIPNPFADVNQTTTYTLTVWEAGHPLCATSDQVVVNYVAGLDPGLDNTVYFCFFDDPANLNDLIGGNPSPGGTWTNAQGNVVANTTFNPQNFPNGGTSVFTYTVGANDCEYFSTLTIIVETSAENAACCLTNAVAGADFAICELTAQLSAEAPLGTGSWTSNIPGVIFSNVNSTNPTVTVPAGGLYTFTFTDNNGVNCAASDQMTVHFSPQINIVTTAFQEPTCAGNCDGQIVVTVTGGIAPLSYSWSGGTEVPNIPFARVNFCQGIYALTITDGIGCEHQELITFTDPPPPPFNTLVEKPICFKECNGYIGILAPNAVQFTFDGGETYNFDAYRDTLCAGEYMVGIIDIFGCENMQQVIVEEQDELVADFNWRPSPVSILDAVVHFNNLSHPTPFETSYWQFGNAPLLDTSWETNPVYEFPDDTAGIYPVILVITNANGCIDTLIKYLEVKDEYLFYIPNSFTPNGDGINEIFRPLGNAVNLKDYRMQIFDRFGHLVFETTNFEEGWNGRVDGGSYYGKDEVYVYRITAASRLSLEKFEYVGHITMLR